MNRKVKTHVGRDLIQNGEYFYHPPKAILEYIKNGYNYKKPALNAEVNVKIDITNDVISISDNGRGMSNSEINDQFLVMHGENQDRKKNNPTDGMFGTGKCAFLGIANILEVKTAQKGKFNHFIISRKEIKGIKGTEDIPVTSIKTDIVTDLEDGTLIECKELKNHVKKNKNLVAQITSLTKKIIRNKKDTKVFIQNNLVEIKDPEIDFYEKFPTDQNEELKKIIKNTNLVINVSKSFLDNDEMGINIYSKTVHLDKTLGGLDNNQYSKFIFGEISIDELSNYNEGELFNNNRDGLNKNHPLVKNLINFIGQSVENIIKKIQDNQKDKKKKEEDKKLDKFSEEIENKINKFWNNLQTKPENQLAGMSKGKANIISKIQRDMLVKGDEKSTTLEENNDLRLLTDKKIKDKNKKNNYKNRKEDENSEKNSKSINKNINSKSRYSVVIKDLGNEENRCLWRPDRSTIYINTGHEQIKNLRIKYGSEDKFFRFFIQDLAFSEFVYAIVRQYMDEKIVTNPMDAFFYYQEFIDDFSRQNIILDDD